ncbi:restriction endonuclease subunit S [Salmonella bongori]|uniref:restriction endonuclease subunit S n=1 Tax=Salmonella bongori TaxID=54736 RepID=UPI0015EC064C|nr:restriction endonuclease subunit S [Salmonella bongori]MBA3226018.1 restriction endonuclease subunit S [Salmonella bongori]
MSALTYLEKLLDGAEIEWSNLGRLCDIFTGGEAPQNHIKGDTPTSDCRYPIYGNGAEIYGYADNYRIGQDAVTISSIGANTGTIYFRKAFFTPIIRLKVVIPKHSWLLPRYLFHYLSSQTIYSKSSSVPNMNASDVKKLGIPIPCPHNPEKSLAIQSEIVRILDTFTALTAELTAELSTRKKQYNYYRDQLLSFNEGQVEWKTLGDVTKKWYSGGTPTAGKAEYYDNGDIPWLRTQEVKFSDIDSTEIKITQAALKNSAAKWIPENCVIIAISGATAGRSAINKIPLTTNQHCGCLEIDDTKALYRYVFHWVSFNYENIKFLGQGARGDLNSTIIKNFRLPIPYATDPDKSLEEQARIVEILDKFDTLTNSITEGLPREIELRQKQYEYYRDLLFSFPKTEAVTD